MVQDDAKRETNRFGVPLDYEGTLVRLVFTFGLLHHSLGSRQFDTCHLVFGGLGWLGLVAWPNPPEEIWVLKQFATAEQT